MRFVANVVFLRLAIMVRYKLFIYPTIDPNIEMNRHHRSRLDLRAMSDRALLDAGFNPDLSDDAERELERLDETERAAVADPTIRDLRSMLWSSIDNVESRDLDQIEFVECLPNGDFKLLIGIADVDAFVPIGSALDRHAASNGTSVYAAVETYPMLPEPLSEDLTSLLPGHDRLAVVTELVLDSEGGVTSIDAYRALVHNHAKLAYEPVGEWLEGKRPLLPEIARVPGLEQQIRLQDEATERLIGYRSRHGALNLETIEARPVSIGGRIVDLVLKEDNPARDLIENVMVAANSAIARHLKEHRSPVIQRIVREPERWPKIVELARSLGTTLPAEPDSGALAEFMTKRRAADPTRFPDLSLSIVKLLGAGEYTVVVPGDPDGEHFGLALQGYARSTAPNRRYVDLVTQRLLKATIAGEPPPYSPGELLSIARTCMERDRAAKKVERLTRKAAAALLLTDRIGQTFDAIVTGVVPKGTFVRLLAPPAEGRVVRNDDGMDVGEKVRVRLVATEPERGFIDFEGVG